MKRICAALLAVCLSLSLALPAFASESQAVPVSEFQGHIVVDGVTTALPLDQKEARYPLVRGDTVYIPLMTAGQWLGADVVWNPDGGSVTITHNGMEPTLLARQDMSEAGVTRKGWGGLEDSAWLRSDVSIIVDGQAVNFSDPSGAALHPLQVQEHVLLPLEVVLKLQGKQTQHLSVGLTPLIHLYSAPTQAEYVEAADCLATVRGHLNAARRIVEGEVPQSHGELTTKITQIQNGMQAILELPAPAFQGLTPFIEWLQERALSVLSESVDPYLPVESSSGTAEAQGLAPSRYAPPTSPEEDTPERKWAAFTWGMLGDGLEYPATNTYFVGLEYLCATSEDFFSRVSPAVPSAAAFTDAAQVTHWEAVTALCKLGIVNGKDDGAFHPTDTVTRAEAAKLIALIMNGGETPDGDAKEEPTFSDISGHWAEDYIEYCTELGIISGRGDGTFAPDEEVTKFQLLKMAEVMLGYDADESHLTGSYWKVATHDLAQRIGLYAELPEFPTGIGVAVYDTPLTRDAAAQILYNALNTTPYIETTTHTAPDGSVTFSPVYATKPDGTSSSLLWERFGVDQVDDLPEKPQ